MNRKKTMSKESAEDIACKELGLSLEEIRQYSVDWQLLLQNGLLKGINNFIFLIYDSNSFGFLQWFERNKMTNKQREDFILFLLQTGRESCIDKLGFRYDLALVREVFRQGFTEYGLRLLRLVSGITKRCEIEEFVVEALKLPLSPRRDVFTILIQLSFIAFQDNDLTRRFDRDYIRIRSDEIFLDVTKYGLKDVLCELNLRTMFESFTADECLNFVSSYSLSAEVVLLYFIHRSDIMLKSIEMRPEILKNAEVVRRIFLEYDCKSAFIEDIIPRIPMELLSSMAKDKVSFPFMRNLYLEDNFRIESRRALKEGNYTDFVTYYTGWKDYVDLIPEITDKRFLIRLSKDGFDLSKVESDADVITLLFNSNVALFEIFPNNTNIERSILTFHGDLFTSEDILRFGFHLSTLLKMAKIESDDTDSILESLMYSNVSENIKDAITTLVLS